MSEGPFTGRPTRPQMVEDQLRRRGIASEAVLAAMGAVPREAFVPEHLQGLAYEDGPLSIGAGQTISQPWIVAKMLELAGIEAGSRLLDVGTGSGYAAAVAKAMGAEVFGIERHAALADKARAAFQRLGLDIPIRVGDGTLGWPEHAPYRSIVVAAGAPEIPPALKRQLQPGGRLVIPIGSSKGGQTLRLATRRSENDFEERDICLVQFVPLIGAEGWRED